MNVKPYDGTTRCMDHMDASTYACMTSEPCTYCPTGVSLDKRSDTNPLPYESSAVASRPTPTPSSPLVGHRTGLQANSLTTLHSAFVILSLSGGTAHLSHCDGIPGQGCVWCEGRTF